MKLLYIFTSASMNGSSVQTKVINQIQALNENGVDCKGLFFTTDEFDSAIRQKHYDYITVPRIKQKYFRSLKQRNVYHRTVYQYFEKENPEFDFIYFRYDNASSFISGLTKKYPGKIFFEHVTAETEEIKLYGNENPLRLNLSSVLGNLEFMWLPLWREKIWGKSMRRNAAFGLCNSKDIANHEIKMAGGKYKTLIGGDAVKTSDYVLRAATPALENEFRMVFLKGASTSADFNGLDRLFKGIKNYKGKYKIKWFLHGKNLSSETKMIRELGLEEQVVPGAYIQREEAEQLMQVMHLGISAMGLHRKGIKGTTTIKAREYFARGIPFIFGHHDPDLSESQTAMKYCMEFEANDEPIDFEKVMNWYLELSKDTGYPLQMRKFAENNLDYSVKMHKLKLYLERSSKTLN